MARSLRDSENLKDYQRKRDFRVTGEPAARHHGKGRTQEPAFVIQEHHARRLHFDFRLEFQGVLKSWAITQMPSALPAKKALAIETEDHPIEYASFEGVIPKGQYGAGQVTIWDRGGFEPETPLLDGLENGKVVVFLRGKRLRGRFALIRIRGNGSKSSWLFFKTKPKVTGLKIPAEPKRSPRKSIFS